MGRRRANQEGPEEIGDAGAIGFEPLRHVPKRLVGVDVIKVFKDDHVLAALALEAQRPSVALSEWCRVGDGRRGRCRGAAARLRGGDGGARRLWLGGRRCGGGAWRRIWVLRRGGIPFRRE